VSSHLRLRIKASAGIRKIYTQGYLKAVEAFQSKRLREHSGEMFSMTFYRDTVDSVSLSQRTPASASSSCCLDSS